MGERLGEPECGSPGLPSESNLPAVDTDGHGDWEGIQREADRSWRCRQRMLGMAAGR